MCLGPEHRQALVAATGISLAVDSRGTKWSGSDATVSVFLIISMASWGASSVGMKPCKMPMSTVGGVRCIAS